MLFCAQGLWLLPKLTFSTCQIPSNPSSNQPAVGMCHSLHDVQCEENGGMCIMQLDGYTFLTGLGEYKTCCILVSTLVFTLTWFTLFIFPGFVVGVLWLVVFQAHVLRLQSLPHSEWMISSSELHKFK